MKKQSIAVWMEGSPYQGFGEGLYQYKMCVNSACAVCEVEK